jgi:hypothetical protein
MHYSCNHCHDIAGKHLLVVHANVLLIASRWLTCLQLAAHASVGIKASYFNPVLRCEIEEGHVFFFH